MTVFVCVDDNLGLRFNGRRQSKDRAVIADILKSLDGELFLEPYSAKLFEGKDITPREVEAAPQSGCFFAERPMAEHLENIDRLVLYKWNRVYPADLHFDIRPLEAGFRLVSAEDFEGYSHERITKEEYVK